MAGIQGIIAGWQLHPYIDHFTIALLFVGLVVDLVASIFSERVWLRYMALALMITGALSAAASWFTGHLAAQQVGKLLEGPGRSVLHLHAQLGQILMFVFAALAVWRILIQAFSFMTRTRQIYLALALIAVGVLLYQGKLGGELVFDYGAGTRLLAAGAAPASPAATQTAPAVEASPSPIPTVYVPTATPTPAAAGASPGATATTEPSAKPNPSAGGSPGV